MAVNGKHGVTSTTPQNVLLGAGTYHKGMKVAEDGTVTIGEIIGATSGGGKISIVGEFYDIPVDGALVKVKGLTVKNGGTVTAEVNFIELSPSVIQAATLFEASEGAEGYTIFKDKAEIAEGDYVEGFGFVGKTANGAKDIIFIMDNALCTSGLEIEGKNKEAAVVKLTLECYANNEGDLDTLPVKILYPADPTV